MSERIKARPAPTGVERFFAEDQIIVSKTDLKGVITYANEVFVGISGYSEEELLGQPHNLIRHPDMPRVVFQLLWETVGAGREIFAYVKNMCRSGDHYWVLAHVTPTFDDGGRITGYHSNRRVPERKAVEQCEELYRLLLAEEQRHANAGEGMKASRRLMEAALAEAGKPYEEFVFAL
ncbi:MAG: PAS domain-containing protein [Acidobacteria bacterium]|nr:PAS domain-containing protein [Acidobacteriota bacterium]